MASRISPYVDNTGLVFAYDLANVSRSYLGEPTTNLWGIQSGTNVNNKSGWSMPYAYNGAITNSVYSSGTWNGNRIWEVLHTAGTSGYGGYESWRECVDQPTAGSGTYSTTRRVAMKICILEGSITDLALHSGGGNGSHNGGAWTAIPASQVPKDCPVKTGWYQFLEDGSWNSNSVGHCVGLGFISYNRVKLLITEPMYYPSNKLIPFTGYQRGATQGLKDLTGRSTIDLTNVSFDSNAQMTFDGTDDYITAGNNPYLAPGTGNFTYSCWINPAGYSYYAGLLVVATTGGLWIGKLGSNMVLRAYNVEDYLQYSTLPTVGQWTNVVITRAGTAVTLYYNANSVATATTGYNFVQATAYIGNDGPTSSANFNGKIANTSFYNRALSASEIQQNFNAIKGRYGL